MARYHFFVSYSSKDGIDLAKALTASLRERGYSVWLDVDSLSPGMDFAQHVYEIISDCDCFLPIITNEFLTSTWAAKEVALAVAKSQERAKPIIPLVCTTNPWSNSLQMLLGIYQWLRINSIEDIPMIADRIDKAVGTKFKSAVLYEKLAEYRALKHAAKEFTTICQILELLCAKWSSLSLGEKQKDAMEICKLLERLSCYPGQYGEEAKAVGYRMRETWGNVANLLKTDAELFADDLFFSAFAVRLNYLDWEVRTESVDLTTSGDVMSGCIDPFPVEQWAEYQKPYVQAFEAACAREEIGSRFTQEEADFIRQTREFIITPKKSNTSITRDTHQAAPVSEDEAILLSVAKFMQEGNKLFDALQKKGIAGDFLKCLLTSYERLKNYCQVVGATNVAAECVDRIVEIREQLDKQDDLAPKNEKAEDGIKSLLGFTLRGSGNYDVFISFKSEDSDLAENVYRLCQRHMKVPFWSKRTLPELSKSEYEDAIYEALRKSKHFVVVLSKLEYLQANWIMREMKAFDRAITEGRKPGGNFVIVATDEVYNEIIRCNKMCLDERYCGYQILKMSEYEKTLMQYIT